MPGAGGTVSGGGTFTAGSSQTVTAAASNGYAFANWTENGTVVSASASYTFTLSANRTLVAHFLRNEGYQVVEAGDGPEGVLRFAESGPFDLVLLDLNLPVFSGVEVCRRIRCIRASQPPKRG